MSRPLIGVSGSIIRDNGGAYVDLRRAYVNDNYLKSVERSGGTPAILPFTENDEVVCELMEHVDGLILSGGHDVSPLAYGEEPLQGLGDIWPERDHFDMMLLKEAERRNLPVFAICRGMQVLNVYRGGSLYQDLKYAKVQMKHSQGQTPGLATHTIEIEADSRLAEILGVTTCVVNSHHHQTVHREGKNLRITARAKDGTIEALEDPSRSWFIACQYHPEMMAFKDKRAQALFDSFVAAAKKG